MNALGKRGLPHRCPPDANNLPANFVHIPHRVAFFFLHPHVPVTHIPIKNKKILDSLSQNQWLGRVGTDCNRDSMFLTPEI